MDDYSPRPIAPQINLDEFEEIDEVLNQSEERIARVYFDKNWEGVQDMFLNKIEAYEMIGGVPASLPADEYKIEAVVRSRVAAELKEILMQVQNAVTASEKRKRGK